MSMKRSVLSILTVSVIAFSGMNVAIAADGKINFTGDILETACKVDTTTQTVPMGTINKSAFSGPGDLAAPKKFSITLKDCPISVTSARVTFDGEADTANSSLLALNEAGAATGVGLALFESDGSTPVPVSVASKAITLDTEASNINTLSYIAKYMATGPIVAGNGNATTDFTVIYN
ncbi:fimbrial protein [Serratia fonticola]|uniref:fimbrial protein n=1 Tax=Serratia fonticola TaxID=47917 RepID=UPI00192B54AB|nr:fimbrial protein [Serratia fonticola]MBL5903126.1 fimbrial protein [Serratia fonticola]